MSSAAAVRPEVQEQRSRAGWLRNVAGHAALGVAYLAAYVGLDWLSFFEEFRGLDVTLWNPQPALTLILIIQKGAGYTPFALAAPFLSDWFVRDFPLSLAGTLSYDGIFAVGYVGLALLMRRFRRIDADDARVQDMVWLVATIVLGCLAISAACAEMLRMLDIIKEHRFRQIVGAFWIGDASGVLAFLPFFITWRDALRTWRRGTAWQRVVDLSVFACSVGLALFVIFGLDDARSPGFFYLLFVPVCWAAVRLGVGGAASACVIVQLVLVLTLDLLDYPPQEFRPFQVMMLALTGTGLLIGTAITQRGRAEAALRAREAELSRLGRITSLGAMGSALAHQISQPIASVATYAHAAQRMVSGGAPDLRRLGQILTSIAGDARRAGEILRRLRDFVAHGTQQTLPVDLTQLLQRTIRTIRESESNQDLDIRFRAAALPAAMGDELQLEQVFLNLLRNAVDATSPLPPARRRIAVEAGTSADAVEIAIEDNGSGIAASVEPLLFEPFETTKAAGMGLGLSISRQIVESHGGKLWYERSEGGGARFVVRLPIAKGGCI
jgi:signal transduction histidine kinase